MFSYRPGSEQYSEPELNGKFPIVKYQESRGQTCNLSKALMHSSRLSKPPTFRAKSRTDAITSLVIPFLLYSFTVISSLIVGALLFIFLAVPASLPPDNFFLFWLKVVNAGSPAGRKGASPPTLARARGSWGRMPVFPG